MSSPANVPVKVGAASSPRNVEEEEQILEAQFVSAIVAPLASGGIRPVPDNTLAVFVPIVVGTDRWKQSHCITRTNARSVSPQTRQKSEAGMFPSSNERTAPKQSQRMNESLD